MSFAVESENIVKQLIQAEYKNACEKFGNKYNSLHEGYAVLLEEVEEAENELNRLKSKLQTLWKGVKEPNTIVFDFLLSEAFTNTIDQIRELAQVGAVLMKIENTIGEVKENDDL